MDQVLEAVGNPKGKSMDSDGQEIWTYNDSEKNFIPTTPFRRQDPLPDGPF